MQPGIFYAASRYTNKSGLIHSGSVMEIAINMVSCISLYALVQATGLSLLTCMDPHTRLQPAIRSSHLTI